jgi:hypothetical protein
MIHDIEGRKGKNKKKKKRKRRKKKRRLAAEQCISQLTGKSKGATHATVLPLSGISLTDALRA